MRGGLLVKKREPINPVRTPIGPASPVLSHSVQLQQQLLLLLQSLLSVSWLCLVAPHEHVQCRFVCFARASATGSKRFSR